LLILLRHLPGVRRDEARGQKDDREIR
jgi:hypothetical protein